MTMNIADLGRANIGPVDRGTILDLAVRAGTHGNRPLGELLLTVAGMLRADGRVDAVPDPTTPWEEVFDPRGPLGVGMTLALHRLHDRHKPAADAHEPGGK